MENEKPDEKENIPVAKQVQVKVVLLKGSRFEFNGVEYELAGDTIAIADENKLIGDDLDDETEEDGAPEENQKKENAVEAQKEIEKSETPNK